jgi:hypothetical protein
VHIALFDWDRLSQDDFLVLLAAAWCVGPHPRDRAWSLSRCTRCRAARCTIDGNGQRRPRCVDPPNAVLACACVCVGSRSSDVPASTARATRRLAANCTCASATSTTRSRCSSQSSPWRYSARSRALSCRCSSRTHGGLFAAALFGLTRTSRFADRREGGGLRQDAAEAQAATESEAALADTE